MTILYSIYLRNHSPCAQPFWCFMAPPAELGDDPGIYANSSASLVVEPNSSGLERFVIPVRYVVGAAAASVPVGRGIEIVSNVVYPVSLGDTWDVNYADAPPEIGPSMALATTGRKPDAIAITTNGFDRTSNEAQGWFSSQSFGIRTDAGFIGMSWSPDPSETRIVTPRLAFYVTVGSFVDNRLAGWDEVSSKAAVISAPLSFDSQNRCTATYADFGGWIVDPGVPAGPSSPG